MKLFNILKKESSKSSNSKKTIITKLDNNQLNKVIGGAEVLAHELAHVKQQSTK